MHKRRQKMKEDLKKLEEKGGSTAHNTIKKVILANNQFWYMKSLFGQLLAGAFERLKIFFTVKFLNIVCTLKKLRKLRYSGTLKILK